MGSGMTKVMFKIRGNKGISAWIVLKISIEFEAEGVKILSEVLDCSIEIKFRG